MIRRNNDGNWLAAMDGAYNFYSSTTVARNHFSSRMRLYIDGRPTIALRRFNV